MCVCDARLDGTGGAIPQGSPQGSLYIVLVALGGSLAFFTRVRDDDTGRNSDRTVALLSLDLLALFETLLFTRAGCSAVPNNTVMVW